MAGKKAKSLKNDKYVVFKKLFASVAMLAFLVVIISGMKAEARFVTIAYRASIAMLVIFTINRIIIRVLASYEEMNSEQA